MNESNIKKKIIKTLNSIDNFFAFRVEPNAFLGTGTADIICCFNGIFIAIETKIGKNKASPSQLKFLKKVNKAKGYGFICYSEIEVIECLITLSNIENLDGQLSQLEGIKNRLLGGQTSKKE